MFSDPAKGNKILQKAKLYPACRKFFRSPLEFVHNFYSFKTAFERAEGEILKAEKSKKSPD